MIKYSNKPSAAKPWLFIPLSILLFLQPCRAQNTYNIIFLFMDMNRYLQQIDGSSPSLGDGDLAPLDFLAGARIVGLGEATHGTKEFFEMKHRIFKYLAEKHKFKIFGFECDFAESIYFDRYINGEPADLTALMKSKMHFWTWETAEVRNLLEWMRNYNLGKAERDRIHYIGVDCQAKTYHPALLKEYLLKTSPLYLAEIEPLLKEVESLNNDDYKGMSQNQLNMLNSRLNAVLQYLTDKEQEFIALSSAFDYKISKQLVRTMIQVNDVLYGNYHNLNKRDEYMAENSLWLLDLLSGNPPLALWAHNAHVANDSTYGGTGSMGSCLRKKIGDQYKVVGFSFSKGSFTAMGKDPNTGQYQGLKTHTIDQPPLKDSITALFNLSYKKEFILRLDNLPDQSYLKNWLKKSRKMLSIGSIYDGNPQKYYLPTLLSTHFDVVVHFNSTNFAVQLDWL